MRIPITLPDIGPARLSVWFAETGEAVYEGDRIVEVMVEGATIDVPCPANGTLVDIRALTDDALVPGQILGMLESDENAG
jgi:pyruvate/2-oxoglutarate dehydrogenase complex dihydrolipoamide acyltransferase (E2) component